MIYSTLGTTSLQVSRVGLGTVQLGMPYGLDDAVPPSDDTCIDLVHTALDFGINFIDTASEYGRSEELIGKACASSPHSSVICTKVSLPSIEDKDHRENRLHIATQIERSRRLLQRDELDLVKLHSLSKPFTSPALLETLEYFTNTGWVRHWGVTTYGLQAPLNAAEFPANFAALQVAYNALDRSLETELFPFLKKQKMGIVIRSIFLQGFLAERFSAVPAHLQPLKAATNALRDIAQQSGLSLASLAFRFAVFHADINTALFGTTSKKELRDNMAFYHQGPLSDDLISAIRCVELSDSHLLNPANWRLST